MSRHIARRCRRLLRSPAPLPLAAAVWLAIAGPAAAQDASGEDATAKDKAATLDTVTVTAQKRSENLQEVPISLQVLGNEKLEQLNLTKFDDYVRYLPSVSSTSSGTGFAQVYMRGVASGGDGNHSGSLPSVGVYLDEQPVTTIQGAVDVHMYDIERVEVLSGPQGTLYGASAESGAVRIITNKPDPSGFEAGYSVELNSIDHGGIGHVEEGFVNLPLTPAAAIRLVGWNEHDAGYIDNVAGTRTFPSSGITISNASNCVASATLQCVGHAKNDYNDADISGARAALKLDLNDDWTVTTTLMGQHTKTHGVNFYDSQVGDLALTHWYPESSDDRWWQAALTVEGKIGNFDLTYAYAHLKRNDEVNSDYSDYSFWYDTLYSYGAYLYDNDGALINPSQHIVGKDRYVKDSHELRIASPAEARLRFVGGLFWQLQKHNIQQDYIIDGLADSLENPGWSDSLWLTKQERMDKDEAIFGELSFDFTSTLTATLGGRWYEARNSLEGYFGFSEGYYPGSSYGQAGCISSAAFETAPCLDFDKVVRENGRLGKFNLTWKPTASTMFYATWSEGYRPGGINRRGTLLPYLSDKLTNYELGWKTSWLGNALTFNGSVFREDWKDFQFSILGANGLTEIQNANQARIDGTEMELNWAATYNLHLSAGVAYYDAKLTANYCGYTDSAGNPVTDCSDPEAPKGARLPITPKFKGNLVARYSFDLRDYQAYFQGAVVHVGKRTADLRTEVNEILGDLPAYTTLDFAAGIARDDWSVDLFLTNALDKRAVLNRFTECSESICGAQVYTVTNQPRTISVRFSQKF
ncbi:MAG: TonB-dependent receptor [Pseudoxanthomonas sp.]